MSPLRAAIREFGMKRLRERIKRVRGEMTQDQFGDLIGKSGKTIMNWENGKTEPSISDIVEIARATGANPAELAFGDLSEIENADQIALVSAILSLEEQDISTAKEVITALSLKSHARRIKL